MKIMDESLTSIFNSKMWGRVIIDIKSNSLW